MVSGLQNFLLPSININIFYAFKYVLCEGVRRFHQTRKGVHGTKKVKNPCFRA
jgi:hypothetical protein